jgi:hypothetical protein
LQKKKVGENTPFKTQVRKQDSVVEYSLGECSPVKTKKDNTDPSIKMTGNS